MGVAQGDGDVLGTQQPLQLEGIRSTLRSDDRERVPQVVDAEVLDLRDPAGLLEEACAGRRCAPSWFPARTGRRTRSTQSAPLGPCDVAGRPTPPLPSRSDARSGPPVLRQREVDAILVQPNVVPRQRQHLSLRHHVKRRDRKPVLFLV